VKKAAKKKPKLSKGELAAAVLAEKVARLEKELKYAASSIENFEKNIIPKFISINELYRAERHRLRVALENFAKQLH